jgi:hypothetical protein
MKSPFLSPNSFSESSMFSTARTAHSGPELVSCVPQAGLARELAQALIAEHVQLTAHTSATQASSFVPEYTIALARR